MEFYEKPHRLLLTFLQKSSLVPTKFGLQNKGISFVPENLLIKQSHSQVFYNKSLKVDKNLLRMEPLQSNYTIAVSWIVKFSGSPLDSSAPSPSNQFCFWILRKSIFVLYVVLHLLRCCCISSSLLSNFVVKTLILSFVLYNICCPFKNSWVEIRHKFRLAFWVPWFADDFYLLHILPGFSGTRSSSLVCVRTYDLF